jgi:hypothetical protein
VTLLERNLGALYARHPGLRQCGLEQAAAGELEIVPAATGAATALLGGAYVHSRYDPVREARRLLALEVQPETSSALFLGLGLGYLPEAFLALHPGRPLAVVEPEPALFVQALACRDLTALLSSPDVSWFLGEEPEAVIMGLDALPLSRLAVLRLRPLYLRRLAYYRKLELLVRSLADRKEVNLNTLRRFGRLWVRNLLDNLEEFVRAPGVSRLQGLFTGIPALVLAAGPSLESVLGHLGELRTRLLLVAVDTSYPLCLRAGVEPDFLVTVDPQYWNSRHLDRMPIREAVLVCEPAAHPSIFRRLGGQRPALYFVSSFFPIGRFLEEHFGVRGKVGAGGSVATTAWDLARLLGASPLYMAGLDLGYPGRRTHCRGAYFEELVHVLGGRLAPGELAGFRALTEAGAFPARSAGGGTTLTDRRMVIYQWWFENQLKQHGAELATYSLSEHGLAVAGMKYRPPDSLLELPPARDRIDEALARAREWAKTAPLAAPEAERAWQAMRGLRAELERIGGLAGEALALCSRARVPEERTRSRALARLDALDRQILNLSSRQVAGFLFQPLIQKILDGAAPAGGMEGLALSEQLYAELGDSARYQAGLIARALKRRRIQSSSPGGSRS